MGRRHQFLGTIRLKGNDSLIVLLFLTLLTSGCSSLAPITTVLETFDAAKAVEEDKKQPTTIETVVRNTKEGIIVESSSPDHSTVNGIPVIDKSTYPKPDLDVQKGFSSVPTWLYFLVIASGFFYFINRIRLYYKSKEEALSYDSSRIIDDGWRSSDGRSVQIHGQCSEEQAEATRNADEDESAEVRPSKRRPRISNRISKRSSE